MVLPGGASAFVARLYQLLPERVVVGMLPKSTSYDLSALTIAEPKRDKPGHRLLIGPTNFAGQGWQWARAVEREIDEAEAVSLAFHMGAEFGYAVDVSVPATAYVLSKSWQRRQLHAIKHDFTHVLVEAGRHPAGGVYRETFSHQLAAIQRSGVRVAYLSHGTDLRVPSEHAEAVAASPFTERESREFAALEKQARANRDVIRSLTLDCFVSTPDLLVHLPEAQWLPVVVDGASWHSNSEVLKAPLPIVVHAPSNAAVKGSDLIDPIMQQLHDEGLIEYRRLSGIPAEQMPAAYRDADIVLDQFRLGSYGVAACEAMAAGRLVVGHVTPQVREHVKQTTGLELPILESTSLTLERDIRRVLAHREAAQGIAQKGPGFVESVHNGARSAVVLRDFLHS